MTWFYSFRRWGFSFFRLCPVSPITGVGRYCAVGCGDSSEWACRHEKAMLRYLGFRNFEKIEFMSGYPLNHKAAEA